VNKLIKNYFCSTLSQERLANLATVSIAYEIASELKTSKIIKHFVEVNARFI